MSGSGSGRSRPAGGGQPKEIELAGMGSWQIDLDIFSSDGQDTGWFEISLARLGPPAPWA